MPVVRKFGKMEHLASTLKLTGHAYTFPGSGISGLSVKLSRVAPTRILQRKLDIKNYLRVLKVNLWALWDWRYLFNSSESYKNLAFRVFIFDKSHISYLTVYYQYFKYINRHISLVFENTKIKNRKNFKTPKYSILKILLIFASF